MKIILFLTILFLSFAFINSFDVDSLDEKLWEEEEGFEHHQCWKDFNGYYTEFAISAFNTFYPTPYGVIPISFFEGGVISADYKKQEMYVHFGIVVSNMTIWGQFWAYGQNNTQYVLQNGTCTASPLTYPFPKTMPKFKKVGETKIGKTDVEVYIIKNSKQYYNYTKQCTLLEKGTCTPMSSNTGNRDKSTKGFALMNFYNYEEKPRHDKLHLPKECYDVTVEQVVPQVNPEVDEQQVNEEEDTPRLTLSKNAYYPKQDRPHKPHRGVPVHQDTDKSTTTKTTTKSSTKTTTITTTSPSTPKSLEFHPLF